MARSESYNTKQKDKILSVIKNQRREFTINDIYNQVKDKVGLTTIYRLVDKLVQDGRLNISIKKDNTTYYQYLEEYNKINHFYLKCDQCGEMEHIDCDCIEELSSHILKKHKFKPNKDHIIINGICEKCIRKASNYISNVVS